VAPLGLGDLKAQKKSRKNGLTLETDRDMYSIPVGEGQRRLESQLKRVRERPRCMWAPLKGV